MPQTGDERASSGFLSFWTSLPGVLTGIAAVLGAVATLAALFFNHWGSGSSPVALSTTTGPTPVSETNGDECFNRYFEGIPGDRIKPLEAGSSSFEAISTSQPKAGTIGLTFTDYGRSIGAIRFAFFPANELFKIESIVDEQCRPVENYANSSRGGDKHAVENWDTVRVRLADADYSLRLGGGTLISVDFQRYVP